MDLYLKTTTLRYDVILEDNYERETIIETSHVLVSMRYAHLPTSTIADTIMDYLYAKAHRSELIDKSMRMKS